MLSIIVFEHHCDLLHMEKTASDRLDREHPLFSVTDTELLKQR